MNIYFFEVRLGLHRLSSPQLRRLLSFFGRVLFVVLTVLTPSAGHLGLSSMRRVNDVPATRVMLVLVVVFLVRVIFCRIVLVRVPMAMLRSMMMMSVAVSVFMLFLTMSMAIARYAIFVVELFHSETPDLVVLDVMLPDINGREVCQRVRGDSTLDDCQIICISGMVEQDKIQDLRDSGANDFMQKPFEIEKLVERICKLLDVEPVAANAR